MPRQEMAGISDNVFSMLTNADMKFESIRNEKGEKVEMSEERASLLPPLTQSLSEEIGF